MGDLVTVVPARDGGRDLFSGLTVTVVAREAWEVCEAEGLAGTTVDGAFEPPLPLEKRRVVDA